VAEVVVEAAFAEAGAGGAGARTELEPPMAFIWSWRNPALKEAAFAFAFGADMAQMIVLYVCWSSLVASCYLDNAKKVTVMKEVPVLVARMAQRQTQKLELE